MTTGKTSHIAYYIAALLWAAMFVSCKNDVGEVDRLLENKKRMPTTIENYTMIRCDSGRVIMRLTAGKVVLEESSQDPSATDKKGSEGVSIISYKKGTEEIDVKLTAHSAIEYGVSGLSEATGDVVVSTADGDSILTERLVWNREEHIFYTDQFARIVMNGDVMLPRKGFRADENFRWYEMFNNSGEISVEDSLSTPSSRPAAENSTATTQEWGVEYAPFPFAQNDSLTGTEESDEEEIPWQQEVLNEKKNR